MGAACYATPVPHLTGKIGQPRRVKCSGLSIRLALLNCELVGRVPFRGYSMECLLNNYLMFPFSLRSPWSNVRGEVVVSATPAGRQVAARADPGRNQGPPVTQPVVWSERTAAQI